MSGSSDSTGGPGGGSTSGNGGQSTTSKRFGETLLAPSLVRLFGRVFTGLEIGRDEVGNENDQPYPSNPLAQNRHPYAQPTCVETHKVWRSLGSP